MKKIVSIYRLLPFLLLGACGEIKHISQGNNIYQYIDSQGVPGARSNTVIEYKVNTGGFNSKLKDKTDYYVIDNVSKEKITKTGTANIDGLNVGQFSGLNGLYYTSESRKFIDTQFEKKPFKYRYGKFALTALTVAMKFRGDIGDALLNPPTTETGFNVNFAPAYRLNWSSFDPDKKFLGNNLTNYSITFGGLLGIGSTDLKKASNAPGLLSDRKAGTYTYGGVIMFGLNSIGIGYAFGFDHAMGTGGKTWVYNDRLWHGLLVAVDLIK